MDIEFPLEPFNTYVRDGSVGAKIKKVMEAVKPEAAYFSARQGKRGGTWIVELKSASDIPRVAEPLFLTFNATVHMHPAMTPEDLGHANLDALGKNW